MTETLSRLLRRMLVVPIVIVSAATAAAHDVPIEEVVTIDVTPQPSVMEVIVRLPIAALADANLPRNEERRLAFPDADNVLLSVQRDVANRLNIRLAEAPLGNEPGRPSFAPDELSATIPYAYLSTRDSLPRLSMDVPTFQAAGRRFRTVARFHDPDGTTRTFSVTGETAHVRLDPGIMAVIRDFVSRAFSAALANTDALLLLLALAVPVRAAATQRLAVIGFFVAQTAAAVIAGLLPLPAGSAAIAAVLTASALVVVTVQNLLTPQSPRVFLVAAAFGLFNGWSLAGVFQTETQFAGAHAAAALDSWLLTLTIVQVWVMALAGIATSLLTGRGVPVTWLSWAVSIYVGHEALHLTADRLRLTPSGSWTLDQLGLLLVAAWIAAALTVGAVDAWRRPRLPGLGAGRS